MMKDSITVPRAKLLYKGYVAIETVVGNGKFAMVIGPYYVEFTDPKQATDFIDKLDATLSTLIEDKI